ncbi:unnamed protein product, partial [Nesidiocoris tenuis]
MFERTSGLGGHRIRANRYMFCFEKAMLVLATFMWKSCDELSLGQMSLSPQNGLTVIVFSSKSGRLLLKPPSMYRSPWNFGGMKPEKIGTKQLDSRHSRRSSLLSKWLTMTFLPSQTRVRETCSLPLTRRWASSGNTFLRPSSRTSWTWKEGLKGPRVRMRASLMRFKTSLTTSPIAMSQSNPQAAMAPAEAPDIWFSRRWGAYFLKQTDTPT